MQWIRDQRPDWDVATWRNGYSVEVARNEIVKEAHDKGVDYLIMLDDDVVASESVLELPDKGKDIVAGISFCWNQGSIFWNAFVVDEKMGLYRSVTDSDFAPDFGLKPVYAVGTAIMCLSRKVIDDPRMRPHFQFKLDEWGTLDTFGGEDVQFCAKARRLGYEVWVDPRTQGEHWRAFGLKQTLIRFAAVKDSEEFTLPEVFGMGLGNLPGYEKEPEATPAPKPPPKPPPDRWGVIGTRLNSINQTLRVK